MEVNLRQYSNLESDKKDVIKTDIDSALIEGLKRAKRSAQMECYKKFVGKMYAIAIRYTSTKEDADEVINSSFLRVFSSIQSFKNAGSFEGWIRTIVKRTSIDHCRKYSYKLPTIFEILDFDVKVYNDALNRLEIQDFQALIAQVPKASRAVFNLFAIDGYSHKEISKALGISIGTSKWHLSNARKKLMDIIKFQKLRHAK